MISRIRSTTIVVSDQDAALTAKGVRFAGPVEMMPCAVKSATLRDPDRNTFFIAEG